MSVMPNQQTIGLLLKAMGQYKQQGGGMLRRGELHRMTDLELLHHIRSVQSGVRRGNDEAIEIQMRIDEIRARFAEVPDFLS